MKIRPMPYHGPGVSVETQGFIFQLWGPNETRSHFAAALTQIEDADQPVCGYAQASDPSTAMVMGFAECPFPKREIEMALHRALITELQQD